MNVGLPSEVSQNFQKLKETTDNTINYLTETTERVKNSLAETTEKAKNILGEATEKAVSAIAETTDRAKNTIGEITNTTVRAISDTTEKAQTTLNETTGNALKTLSEATNQSVISVTEVTQKYKESLETNIQHLENLSASFSQGIESAISAYINKWIASHPTLFWIANHPIQTILIAILIIFLIPILLNVLANLVKQIGIFVLKSPFKLSNSLISTVKERKLLPTRTSENLNRSEQRSKILGRLDAIKQEQEELLQELATIVKSDDSRSR
jgi:DNA anti-recombination protein RmuC